MSCISEASFDKFTRSAYKHFVEWTGGLFSAVTEVDSWIKTVDADNATTTCFCYGFSILTFINNKGRQIL